MPDFFVERITYQATLAKVIPHQGGILQKLNGLAQLPLGLTVQASRFKPSTYMSREFSSIHSFSLVFFFLEITRHLSIALDHARSRLGRSCASLGADVPFTVEVPKEFE
jgi:hypothetical protein